MDRNRVEYIYQCSYWNLSGGFLIRVLLCRGDEPKGERLLDFPPRLPLFATRAFPPGSTTAGVFASDLLFFGAEWRIERAFALLAAVAPESCVVGGWMERGSPIGVASAASDVP
jgi:hypothetical protein